MPMRMAITDTGFAEAFDALVNARREADDDVSADVRAIIQDVRDRGDEAVAQLTSKFDQHDLEQTGWRVDQAESAAALEGLEASLRVALELAAADTPMVSAYDMNWLSRRIVQRMMQIDTANLINIVSDTRTVPEFIGAQCRSDLIAQGVLDLLQDPAPQRAAMQTTMDLLGRNGEDPGLRAARAVLARL